MSYVSSGETNPTSSPKGSPSHRYSEEVTNLILVIQSVTDQSKALGSVSTEVCSLKETLKDHSVTLQEVRDKTLEFGYKIAAVEKSVDKISNELKSGISEIKSLIEKQSTEHKELLKETKTSIVDKLDKLETEKVDKLEKSVINLQRFAWLFNGGVGVIVIGLTIWRLFAKSAGQ